MSEGDKMKKIAMYSIGIASLAAAGLVIIPSFANAQSVANTTRGNGNGGGYQQMIEAKAKLVGMTTSELKTQLQTKTMVQVAQEKNVSEDQLRSAMEAAARARWVERGLSQSEIDSRLKNMTERQAGDHEANRANRGNSVGYGRFNQ
jgi:hypothetical protein